MDKIRLHEGELNIMELLWSNGQLKAKDIAKIIKEYIGWEKNTTYTVIKRLIEKGAVSREEPGFLCKPMITKRKVLKIETQSFLEQFYEGSLCRFFTDYLGEQALTMPELLALEKIISEQKS